ncbi:molybdopterin-dependent oxidoreductase [Chloroflexota bacterium]
MEVNKGSSQEKVVWFTCTSHCAGQCLFKVHVKDGVVARIETDDRPDEPQYRGCFKGHAYRQLLYHPDRLKYPLRRVGERGEGKFERISWDVALDTIASELKRVKETYGPAARMLLSSGGDVPLLNLGGLVQRLLNLDGGCTTQWGFHSFEGASFAALTAYASWFCCTARDDLPNSRLIILWAWDPANTIHGTTTTYHLMKAKEAGAKIIAVDPRLTDTAATFADQWIPIKPCTDAAMLVAMAYVIIKEKLQDQAYLDRYTVGFDQFKHYVMGNEDGIPKTPAWAETITGVPASTIENLAREYATTKPAALMDGIAPGRTAYGEQYHRAAIALAAMTGNIGIHGGNAPGGPWRGQSGTYPFKMGQRLTAGANPVEAGAPPRPNAIPCYDNFMPGWNSSAKYTRLATADAMLGGKAGGYPSDYKLLYIVNYNCLNQWPDIKKTVRAFKKMEFIVVQEQFMTPTAKFADIVLPMTTRMERNDICTGGSIPMYGYMNKVVEPLYECKSHFEICQELAKRLGITNYSDKTDEELLRQIIETGGDTPPDYEAFKEAGIYKLPLDEPHVAFKEQIDDPENNPFGTPSGTIEIYSQVIADMKIPEIPPVPKYIEPWEGPTDPLREKYPLQVVSIHSPRRAHTQCELVPWLRELVSQAIEINASDAYARGIADGDMVRVFNDRGEMLILVKVTERIMPGVVAIPQGAWYDPDENGVDRGGNPNIIMKAKHSPGAAFVTNTCLAQVTKA